MAKSVLFLHIGTPKTGTSAIQLFLVTNREALEKKGWTYPDFGFVYPDASETRNALWLAREMDPSDDENRKKAMPQLLSAAEQFPHMILSEESLWTQGGYCSEGREHFWRTFASFLKENDIDLKIIVYLRRQDQYLYSYWAQKVKKRDETRLFRQFAEEFGLAHTKLDYCAQLDLIADGVGAENLIVRPYDRSRFENGSIVYDFLGVVGLTPDDSFVFPEESNRLDIYASMEAAKDIGGDFYDFFRIDDDRVALVIADVCGKGIPAALFMAISRTIIRSKGMQYTDTGKCMTESNLPLVAYSADCMFVTVFYAVYNMKTGLLAYCNAGHNRPVLLHSDGTTEILPKPRNLIVGAYENASFKEDTLQLETGDTLVMYTDGVTEATNLAKEAFGLERFCTTLSSLADKSSHQIVDAVRASISDFAAGAEQSDDITMLVLKRK